MVIVADVVCVVPIFSVIPVVVTGTESDELIEEVIRC